MRRSLTAIGVLVLAGVARAEPRPLSLHPENPHYFLFRGKPTVLITSGEHYGAVLNLDFDYVKYLETLQADRMNLTRTFSGAYVEPQGAFRITKNTLAPEKGRFIAPWARSGTPGYAGGGAKFDLKQWNEEYFNRLKDFVQHASRCGVVVEMVLFCPFYKDDQWKLSPLNVANNIQGIGEVARTDVYTLDKHGGLLDVQETMVRRIVHELRGFDNVYYEVSNEPYFGGVTLEWQHRIAEVILDAEKDFPHRHLISRNVANGSAKITKPHPAFSIFNFHYATPPKAVALNYALEKVIGDNETGFKGNADRHYRMEGWEFILAGGGLYNNLDYSFAVGHEDGSFEYPDTQPGGGSKRLRRQLRALREFIEGFDFIRMQPRNGVIRGGVPDKARARALVEPGKAWAVYITDGGRVDLELELPGGRYEADWLDPVTGRVTKSRELEHAGGVATLSSPEYAEDIALRVLKKG